MPVRRLGVLRTPGIRHRLAAARLLAGIRHVTIETLQQFERRHSHLRVELVDITGHEQTDLHRRNASGNPPST